MIAKSRWRYPSLIDSNFKKINVKLQILGYLGSTRDLLFVNKPKLVNGFLNGLLTTKNH